MDRKNPIVNYPTPPTTSHNFSAFSLNIKSDSENYPYAYSPTINNCITSTDKFSIVSSNLCTEDNTSNPNLNMNMNMNNYNGINMYNTTSIISNNDGSTYNNSNGNNNNYNNAATGNTYPSSNQAPSYSNINYTNINNSIQPLSPKEMPYMDKSQVIVNNTQQNTPQNIISNYNQKSNQPSQSNYVNYNSNNNQINNNIINNSSTVEKSNGQKLSINTSFTGPNDHVSSPIVYSNGNENKFNIKTPIITKDKIKSNPIHTPPMTPMPEKNKKKRGEHIHYNIKTNMFEETRQYYELYNNNKSQTYDLQIIPKVDRGFFPTGPENDFTCYRRNYFQISVSFTANNIKNPNEFGTPFVLKYGDEYLNVENFYIGICAKVKGSNKEVKMVQQTAKREKGPQNKPVPKLCKPGGNPNYYHGLASNQCIVTFERLQFKSATPNTVKRSGSQQFYALVIDLYAETPTQKRYKIASIESKRLISPYTPSYSQIPYNENRNGYDNYNSTAAAAAASSTITGTSYPNENTGTNSTNSYYSLNNSSMNSSSSSSRNGYMYQTPPLPPQNPQSINTSIAYNVSKQEMISPYSTDGQNTYSPYVQGSVNIFSSQGQSSPATYPSNNYYPQNTNSGVQVSSPIHHPSLSQNVNTANGSSYYASNNQDIIFSTISNAADPSNNFIITQAQPPSTINAVEIFYINEFL
ncbi:p53-like transcription factor [Neocallimastix lanati (nom. inval.)]|uniref:p53-like transcription factor n=1 Tax=Neocallimastix californiae TaxID=1754190 RepID=A0A1Y2E2K6_9FUNG|nr:p53-like transcription factor [Neocallimastix sp. JGI-2020a]ORY65739.1 p53-like transcription factor [Neocallimastix californiae]|eukprot:ORY65739.1 p53-like transcription factor [Neocallimastix californiae]